MMQPLHRDAWRGSFGSMKTTIDIPENVLADVLRFTKAKTKKDAVLHALGDFNRRQRMAALVERMGRSDSFLSHGELMDLRKAS